MRAEEKDRERSGSMSPWPEVNDIKGEIGGEEVGGCVGEWGLR